MSTIGCMSGESTEALMRDSVDASDHICFPRLGTIVLQRKPSDVLLSSSGIFLSSLTVLAAMMSASHLPHNDQAKTRVHGLPGHETRRRIFRQHLGSNYIRQLPTFPGAFECSYGARLGSSVCSRGNALNSTHRPDMETLTRRDT